MFLTGGFIILVLTGQLGSGQERLAINLYTGMSNLPIHKHWLNIYSHEMLLCDTVTQLNEGLL